MRHGWTADPRVLVTVSSRGVWIAPLLAVISAAACTRGEPPAPPVDAAVAPLPAAAQEAARDDGGAASPAPSSTATSKAVAIDAGDPGSLPQTKDRPSPTGEALDRRATALWDAIAKDDPDLGLPFFFPVTAYEQVKAIPSPASDWRARLVAAYKRDIHKLNARLGKDAAAAKLVRIEIPDERARWIEPNEESNKLGYYRVYGTRLVYSVDGGKERTFDVSSLISWRGEWYVVHLTGFK